MDKQKEAQFMAAYEQYSDAIYRHGFFRLYSESKAEEIVQDAFMKTWEYLAKGNTVENMRAFLYKTANNLIINEIRKKKEQSLESLIEKTDNFFQPSYAGHKDMERTAVFGEIMDLLKSLPEETRKFVILRYVDDFDPKEIAQILDMDVNNVSVKIHRAVKAVKQKYGLKQTKKHG